MNKFVFKYFIDFFHAQNKWLNKKAKEGYRLVGISRFGFYFDESMPGEYVYEIEYIGNMKKEDREKYLSSLKNLGYKFYTKPLNINYSFGKIKLRLWEDNPGKFATIREVITEN